MPRKCKHENVTGRAWSKAYPRWYAEFKSTKELPAIADALVCNTCGAWLPLGPSDETDERVALEIRGAELGLLAEDARRKRGLTTLTDLGFDGAETAGWIECKHDSNKVPEQDGEWAGYLARVIATHGDEQ